MADGPEPSEPVDMGPDRSTACGMIVAGLLVLSGCAADRAERQPAGWSRIFFPFRAAKIAKPDLPSTDPSTAGELPELAPELSRAPFEPDYQTRKPPSGPPSPYAPLVPPPAPPAVEPESDPAYETTISPDEQETGRPTLLREVLDRWRRPADDKVKPAIPFDEPVARRSLPTTRVVGHQRYEPVILKMPEFE